MKHFYSLVILLSAQSIIAQQHHISEVGIPVDGLETIPTIVDNIPLPETEENTAEASGLFDPVPFPTEGEYTGASKGTFSVSLSGSATYNLPIEVPPGINNIAPQIGIAYDSQAKNGIAGYGWNISGLSTISKTGSNKFIDGIASTITYGDGDQFMLDGQRLVIKSGMYGRVGEDVIYETVNHSNLKISGVGETYYHNHEYFKVEYPDGSTAYYGRTYNPTFSGQEGSKTKTNNVYALTYITTPQNIVIKYNYINDGNNLLVSKIEYGNRNTNPLSNIMTINGNNIISFTYKDRNRPETGYIHNEPTSLTKILDKITVSGFSGNGFFNEMYRSYQLTYKISSLGYEQLQSITETSGDGNTTKNPVSFLYGADPTQNLLNQQASVNLQSTDISLSNITNSNTQTIPGDFSGSGKLGYLMYHKTINDGDKQYTKGDILRIFDPGTNTLYSRNFPVPFNEVVATKTLNYNDVLLPNQGFTTITKNGQTATNGSYSYTFDSYIFMPNYIGQMALTNSKNFTLRDFGTTRDYFISGDFNGDGISDIIRTEYPGNYKDNTYNQYSTQLEIIDLKNDAIYSDQTLPIGFNYQVVDTDGDGYDEFIVIRHGSINIYKFNQTSKKLVLSKAIYNSVISWSASDKRPVYTGDFNGDGKLDFVVPTANNSNNWTFFINAATTFKVISKNLDIAYNANKQVGGGFLNDYVNVDEYSYIFSDINNDGKTDIVKAHDSCRVINHTSNDYDNATELWICENLGFDAEAGTSNFSFDHHTLPTPNRRSPIYTVSNYNQKNYKTELAIITDNRMETLKFERNNVLTQQLKKINEYDIKTNITYDSYDENKMSYVTEDPINGDIEDAVVPFASFNAPMSVYPKADIDVAPGMYLVKKVIYDTSNYSIIGSVPTARKQLFSYGDATMSHDGKGFLGFRGIMQTNKYQGGPSLSDLKDQLKSVLIFDLDNYGIVKEEILAHDIDWANFFSSPVNYISRKTNSYAINTFANKVFSAENTKSVIDDKLTNVQRTVTTTYDTYSNPLSITETKTGNGETSTQKTVFTYLNNNVDDDYYIGRIATRTTTNNNVQTSKETFTYDNHLLTSTKKSAAIGSTELTEENEYDVFGNIIKKTISASDIQPRITTNVYDSSGRYIEKSVDIEGLETNFVYDKNKGWLLSQTSPFGETTSFTYDGFGIPKTKTDNNGNVTSFAYITNGSFSIGPSFVRKETTHPDGSKERITENAWGNKTAEGHTDMEGNWINKSYSYDSQDRLIKQSEPYTTNASLYTTFEYDKYGRIEKSVLPSGKEITVSYNGLSKETYDGTKSRVETMNVNNQLKQVVDNNETINYTYNPNGTLKNTNYGGAVISFEYDGWGRKSKITDPSAGIYSYQYNSFGNLLKQTTPNGTTTNTYDDAGKILTSTSPDRTVNYTYNNMKLLTKVETTNSDGTYQQLFGFNNLGQNISKQFTTPWGYTFYYNYVYDGLGRVLTEEKTVTGAAGTSLFKTKNVYKNGCLWKLQDAGTSTDLKVYNGYNQRGQLTGVTLKNGLSTTYTYDQFGYITANSVSKNNVQQFGLTYTWDTQRGNLTARTNSLFGTGINETFQYDAFDRLTSNVTKQGATSIFSQEQTSYDGRGRIISNNVGDFSYDSSKVYQLQNIDNLQDLNYYQQNPLQQVTYNSEKAPLTIKQQGKENIYFHYDDSNNRTAMFYGNEATDETQSAKARYYSPAGDIEIDYDRDAESYAINMYVDGDVYTASILRRKEYTTTTDYYLHRDYLGSILAITNATGGVVEKRLFDAWGNVLFVQDGQGNLLEHLMLLERGYTGHEHLQGVDLINMNARLYDPKLHRFLTPDNFVQEPTSSQSYNRYGYAWNNPLKYKDTNGEFIIGFLSSLIKGLINGEPPFKTAWNSGVNEMKIAWGIFKTDSNKTFGGQVWEIFSRLTWQLPQTIVGNVFSNVSNWAGQVDNVDYKFGATVLSGNFWGSGGAVTLGSYINGSRALVADPNNSLFQHEYGHYLQSQEMGWGYMARVGIPSFLDNGDHDFHPVEQDANRRAFKYFNKYVNGFYKSLDQKDENRGWDFYNNPLDINNIGAKSRDNYIDYKDPEVMRELDKNLSLHIQWYDVLDPFGITFAGWENASIYNFRNLFK